MVILKLDGYTYVVSLLKDLKSTDLKTADSKTTDLSDLKLFDLKAMPSFFENLKDGQILEVNILEHLGDKLLLDYEGQKFLARANIDTSKLKTINLIYEGTYNGEIRFKTTSILKGEAPLSNLETALNEIEVKVTNKNILIASELISHKLPVTKDNINFIERLTPAELIDKETAQKNDDNVMIEHVKVAALLLKNDLPGNKSLVNMIVNTSKEKVIVDEFKALEETVTLPEISEKITDALKLHYFSSSEGNYQHSLQSLIQDNTVLKLFDVLYRLITSDKDTTDNTIKNDFVLTTSNNQLHGFEKDTLLNTDKGNILINEKDTIVKALGSKAETGVEVGVEVEVEAEAEASKVKEAVTNLIRGFVNETLVNTDRSNNLELCNTYINIPFKIDEKWYPASLIIKGEKDKSDKLSLEKKVFISVSVETQNMSRVKVNLDLFKDNVNCVISVENDLAYELFLSSKDELISSLEETFDVIELKVVKIQEREVSTEIKDKIVGFGRIDIRI